MVRLYQKASYRERDPLVSERELRPRKTVSPTPTRQVSRKRNDDSDSPDDDSQPQDNDSRSQDIDNDVSTMTLGGALTPIVLNKRFVASPHTPAVHVSTLPAEDEVIVYTAFHTFLQGLCIWHPSLAFPNSDIPQWTMKHLEFAFNLGDKGESKSKTNRKVKETSQEEKMVEKKREWKARTDGFLRLGAKAVIIIEVKPYLRSANISDIRK